MGIVAGGSFRCVELLVNAGADINAVDRSFGDGNTPAHKALLYHRKEIFQYLLKQGANIFIANSQGHTVDDMLQNPSVLESPEYIQPEEAPIFCQPSSTLVNPRHEGNQPDLPCCYKCQRESFSFFRNKNGKLICNDCRHSR